MVLDPKKGFSLKYNAWTSFGKSLKKGDFWVFSLRTTLSEKNRENNTKTAFCGRLSLMTSSKVENWLEFEFYFFVFIFWSSFQVLVLRTFKSLLWMLEAAEGAFKMQQNTKIRLNCDIPALLQHQGHFETP